jgi:hypothetical protein
VVIVLLWLLLALSVILYWRWNSPSLLQSLLEIPRAEASCSYGYMFCYDALGVKGQYIYKIQQLHEEYGTPVLSLMSRGNVLL